MDHAHLKTKFYLDNNNTWPGSHPRNAPGTHSGKINLRWQD